MKMLDIGWVAGLVEGEGCIVVSPKSKTLRLSIEMTDLDILQRFCTYFPTARLSRRPTKLESNWHTRYIVHLTGAPMMGLLMTIYSNMGDRRQGKIREAIVMFKSRKQKPYLGGNHNKFRKAENQI